MRTLAADVRRTNDAARAHPDPRMRGGHARPRTHAASSRGETGSRAALIRLALGPDGTVAPDVRAKAGGPRRVDRRRSRDARSRDRQGQAQGRARPRVQDRRVPHSRRPARPDRGGAAPRDARPAGAGGARRHAADRLREDRRCGAQGQRRAAAPRRRCRRRTATASSIRRCASGSDARAAATRGS